MVYLLFRAILSGLIFMQICRFLPVFFALLSKSEAVFYNVARIPCYIRQVYPGQRDSESVFRLQPFFFLALFLLIF